MTKWGAEGRSPQLRTERLILRRWAPADRAPFAAINADQDVVRFLRGPLDRAASDKLIDEIEESFDTLGYGLWALEVRATAQLIGFTGLSSKTFEASFTPAVEVGWRLARSAWGHGYATEAARAALAFGFRDVDLAEIVSMTARTHERSQAVMRRLGMTRDPVDDFDHPLMPPKHPLRPHVLHRITRRQWLAQ